MVIIDEGVAFVGGIDLTKMRWDTPAHTIVDPRRRSPGGTAYRPYHDVQMVVAGEIARALSDSFRSRWWKVTGKKLPEPQAVEKYPWPDEVGPVVEECLIGIARTRGKYNHEPEIREIELLYLDAISRAQQSIYIENQYFTSQRITDALIERLGEKDGPEIIIILPLTTDGWLSQNTMDMMRGLVFERLRSADSFHRLGIYFADRNGVDGSGDIKIHSKLMIVDDCFIRVGSANLNNRSMGMDTECDLAMEAVNRPDLQGFIRDCRERLLAEHLGREVSEVRQAVRENGSVKMGLEAIRGGEKTLKELQVVLTDANRKWLENQDLIDPDRVIEPEHLLEDWVPENQSNQRWHNFLGVGAILLLCLGLAAVWRYTPLGDFLRTGDILNTLDGIRHNNLAFFYLIAGYVVCGLVMIPLTALISVTLLVFGPLAGSGYAMAGACASAIVSYFLGSYLGRNFVRKLAGKSINTLSKKLGKHGLISTIVIRMTPIAPYTVVNLAAGASHIRFVDFLLGTVIGLLPGIIALAGILNRGTAVITSPNLISILSLAIIVLVIVGGAFIIRRWLRELADRVR
jgi:phosphatidylserine/phosphatidylglycerophosphate/cardiolipin synthase-like enzyme/uncharacterized membrane protein YdjX (TVP38/TMEM64 family)